ncbi:MAG: hypothetical protein QUS12_10985 [Methanosarcina sp.]|jgi:hypothetical protein|nr:hypothetical protein [Methanosarcina sp.]MDM7919677.1 hypothetical protein [Methanosarcina sp.]HOW14781.1 hypothetical protein [Methanosarcina sp.]
MPEESKRIKVVRVKNLRVKSLKIKGLRPGPAAARSQTLRNIRKVKG